MNTDSHFLVESCKAKDILLDNHKSTLQIFISDNCCKSKSVVEKMENIARNK